MHRALSSKTSARHEYLRIYGKLSEYLESLGIPQEARIPLVHRYLEREMNSVYGSYFSMVPLPENLIDEVRSRFLEMVVCFF
jgi:hypothetical protein